MVSLISRALPAPPHPQYLPLRATYPDMLAEGVAGVPFLMCHGEADMVVAHEYGKQVGFG